MCSKCGHKKCCCPKIITKVGERGPKGPGGPKGNKGDKGDKGNPGADGQTFIPIVYYVKDGGGNPVMNNGAKTLDDPDLVVANVPAGTYLIGFDADSYFTRGDVDVPETCYFNYFLYDGTSDIIGRGAIKDLTNETNESFKAVFSMVKIILASTKTLKIRYRISSDIPLTNFPDGTSQLQLFARSLTILKVA